VAHSVVVFLQLPNILSIYKKGVSLMNQTYNGWADYTTWNCALWIQNEETLYNLAKVCKDYNEFLYEMQVMCGFFATPDGADYGEANQKEMNELIRSL